MFNKKMNFLNGKKENMFVQRMRTQAGILDIIQARFVPWHTIINFIKKLVQQTHSQPSNAMQMSQNVIDERYRRRLCKDRKYFNQQDLEERRQVLEHLISVKQDYQVFLEVHAGFRESNYTTAVYHIGELQWDSFFITYRFQNDRAPTAARLQQFLRKRIRGIKHLQMKRVDQTADTCVFFILIEFYQLTNLNLYTVKFEGGNNPCVRLTWSIKHLEAWIHSRQNYIPEEMQAYLPPVPKKSSNKKRIENPQLLEGTWQEMALKVEIMEIIAKQQYS